VHSVSVQRVFPVASQLGQVQTKRPKSSPQRHGDTVRVAHQTPLRPIDDLATQRDGSAAPVWAAVSEGKAYVISRGPGKVKRIRNIPAVTIAPCTMRGRERGAEIRGEARIVGSDLLDET
jgi:hypothetical protein